MTPIELRKKSKVGDLANKLRLDMAQRSLRLGDHYLTAAAAGEMLGVSADMANRAMNILAEEKQLVRYPRRGTFVGPGFDDGVEEARTAVHLLEMMSGDKASGLVLGELMSALRTEIPDARLVHHFFPVNNSARHIQNEIEQFAADKSFGGLVLVSCRRDIQENVARSGIPVVVWGSAFPGVDLPCVDLDQTEAGRLMTKLAIEAGSRRFVYITRETWRGGDGLTFQGITQEADEMGLGTAAVQLQNVPETGDDSVMQNIFEPMISHVTETSDEPTAFLCRSVGIARHLHQVAQSSDSWDPHRMAIAFDNAYGGIAETLPFPCIESEKSLKEAFAIVGQMLSEIMDPASPQPVSFKLPVVIGRVSKSR